MQSYSPVMNRAEQSDYGEALQALWIVQRALGKKRDLTWMYASGIKPL